MMRFFHFTTIFLAGIALCACGRSAEKEQVDTQATDTVVASTEVDINEIINGNASKKSETLDNLALNADDLEPREAIAVLTGYLEIEKEAQAAQKHKVALETIRKFVDVYDIVVSNHGNKMRDAIRRNASSTGIDLSTVASQFRNRLHGVDEGSGTEAAPIESADTTAIDKPSEASTPTSSDLFD